MAFVVGESIIYQVSDENAHPKEYATFSATTTYLLSVVEEVILVALGFIPVLSCLWDLLCL